MLPERISGHLEKLDWQGVFALAENIDLERISGLLLFPGTAATAYGPGSNGLGFA